MLPGFLRFIKDNKLDGKTHSVLLAVSGGLDSMVMTHLFHAAGFRFGIVHCNFQLRRKESNADEAFVRRAAKKYKVSFHLKKYATEEYANAHGISIQMAARELRYDFFEKVRKSFRYDYTAVAHHADDSLETVLINLVRGSGIAAYHGIAATNKKIIRPLLFATREEIHSYAIEKKLAWREDSSNASDQYVRNRLRHHVIPVLKEINPALSTTFTSHLEKMSEVESIHEAYISAKKKELLKKNGNTFTLSLGQIKTAVAPATLLFGLLRPFHFNSTTVDEILSGDKKKSGTLFLSSTHELIFNRGQLIISRRKNKKANPHFGPLLNGSKLTGEHFSLVTEKIKLGPALRKKILSGKIKEKNTAYLAFPETTFPLTVRYWQQGDYFYPLGMNHKKLLSDYFIDRKFSLPEKENALLLTSGNTIFWIMGERIDNRFKITPQSGSCFRFIFETKL